MSARDRRVVLSLDQALRCTGYAVFVGDDLVEHGTLVTNDKSNIDERLASISDNVRSLCDMYLPDVVVFEDIQDQNNIATYKKLAFVQAVIMLYCFTTGVKWSVMAPSHWRRVLGGSWGRKRDEQKEHAIDLVRQTCGIEVGSDEADAICIGLAYIQESSDDDG